MRKNTYFIFIILFILISTKLYSQCCSAGNPVGSDGLSEETSKGQLQIISSYRYSNSKDYYHLNKPIEYPQVEKSYYSYQNFKLGYGITNRLRLTCELGYFYLKAQVLNVIDENKLIKSNGLGDVSSSLDILLVKHNKSIIRFSSGTRIPIGKFNYVQDGVYVPVSLQPSSGSFKLFSSLFYRWTHEYNRFSIMVNYWYEWSSDIKDDFFEYNYGDFHQVLAGAYYKANPMLGAAFNIKYEYRKKDRRENDMLIESTGGHVVYLSPLLNARINKTLNIFLMTDLPVYKYVNGYQLTNQYALQIGMSIILHEVMKDRFNQY